MLKDGIFVTPTLVEVPPAFVRIVGTLSEQGEEGL